MAQNATNKRLQSFSPAGLSDAEDAANVFQGACVVLQDLIPSPKTRNLWVCRPARIEITDFPGFVDPGFISALKVIGNRAYGMIASGLNPGKDQPFCYEIDSGNFIAISGITNPNSPASPSPSGDWTPPVMELVGTRIIVTHPGFTGAAGIFFGWIDISNPAVPTWNAGNTSTTPLPFVPVAVANYQGSAVFAVREAAYMTDPLTLVVQAANVFTFGDNVNITAFKGLGLSTELGGITQSLIIFKGTFSAFQLKGSAFASPSTITIDGMNNAVGTDCPLSLVDTPVGIALIAPDGLRFVDQNAAWSEPVGAAGDGVNVPFVNALVPSRVVSACNGSVIIVSVQNGGIAGTPVQEYWLHLGRTPKIWSGPHTFASSLIEPYKNKFITTPVDDEGKLYMCETVPSTTTTYEEMGEQLQWTMTTVMFSNYSAQGVYNFNNMTVNLAIDPSMVSWRVSIVSPNLVEYDAVNNTVPNTAPFWDSAIWDADVWDGIAQGLTPRRVDFTKDVTTSRAQVVVQGGSAAGVIIGEIKYNQGDYSYVPQTGI
jgi:hypothetical protein